MVGGESTELSTGLQGGCGKWASDSEGSLAFPLSEMRNPGQILNRRVTRSDKLLNKGLAAALRVD